MSRKKLSRRQFVAATALSSAALITAPYVRGAHAAGKLTMGFWDHWVPGANKASTALVNEWAEKEKVEVSIDYITEPGQQEPADHRRRSAGEIRPRHPRDADLVAARQCRTARADNDIMEPLIKQNGDVNGTVKYLGKAGDKWLGVPPASAARSRGPAPAST